jgi:VRR-NUC domain
MSIKIDPKRDTHIGKLMSAKDQEYYGFTQPGIHEPYEIDAHPPVKTGKLERDEQRQFANHCLLKGYAPVWHSTAHRSKASIGCPDFIVTVNAETLYIEFKRVGCDLSPDQKEFRKRVEANGGLYFVVFSADEAIALTNKYDQLDT